MARVLRSYTISGNGETKNVSAPVGNQLVAGRIAVYARETAGAGSATLAVRGGFTDNLDDLSNDTVQITAATPTGTGALTVITADGATPFAHLALVAVFTGAATIEVFVSAY